MTAIVQNLSDPSWWFTGIFFVVVALVLPGLFRVGKAALKKTARGLLARSRRRVKNARRDPLLVVAAIGKANAQLAVFLVLAFGYAFALLLLSAAVRGAVMPWGVILALPVLAMEVAWLLTDSYVKDLLRYRRKLDRAKRTPTLPIPA